MKKLNDTRSEIIFFMRKKVLINVREVGPDQSMKIFRVCQFIIFIVSLVFGLFYLNKRSHFEKNEYSDLEKEILNITHELKKALESDVIVDENILNGIVKFNEYLVNETVQNFVLKLAHDNELITLAFDRIDLLSLKCSEKRILRLTFFLISFIRENFIVGKQYLFKCRISTLLNLIHDCDNPTFFQLIISMIMTTLDFKEGGLCLNGAAESFYNYIDDLDYGPYDWDFIIIICNMG